MNLKQQLALQKQTVHSALIEVDSALQELASNPESFKLIGNILVKSDPQKLKSELKEKKEILQKRLSSIEAQEKQAE